MRRRQKLIHRLVLLVCLLLLVGTIELVLRLWYQATGVLFYWHETPDQWFAYNESSYWSPAFYAEWQAVNGHMTIDKSGNAIPADFTGRWYNVRDGERATVPVVTAAKHTIYLLGNSTTFGLGVPDEMTFASYLQKRIPRARVVNRGVSGYSVRQELVLLKSLPLQSGDIVIFYDGSMDAQNAYSDAYDKLPTPCKSIVDTFRYLALVHAVIAPCQQVNVDTDTVAAQYNATVQKARNYTFQHGGLFYHFVEATAFNQGLSKQAAEGRCGMVVQYMPGLDMTSRDLIAKFEGPRVVIDLRDYIDCYHVNERGNAIIARAIYDAISTF